MTKTISFQSFNKRDTITANIWETPNPKGIVELVHGMCEHINRYDDFAKFLAESGYVVCGHDQAGHGRSITEGYMGDFGDTGYETLIEDVHTLRKRVQDMYPGLPFHLFGHSMGSFVLRVYLLKYSQGVKSVIFSGSPGVMPGVNEFVSRCEALIKEGRSMDYIPDLFATFFGNATERFDNIESPFDWICSDPAVVKKYMDDKLCGITFTVRTYYTEFSMLPIITGEQWAKKIPSDLPIMIFTGDMDPVANYGEGQYQLVNWLWNTGHRKVEAILYPGYRHEMLNEPIKQQVYGDVLKFLNKTN